MSLKDVYILTPTTNEYVILHDKREFANVIKLRSLRWKIIPDYLDGPHNHKDPYTK